RLSTHHGGTTLTTQHGRKECHQQPACEQCENNQTSTRRICALRAIHQHHDAYQSKHCKHCGAHAKHDVWFGNELSKRLSITSKCSLSETERIAFELRPGQVVLIAHFMEETRYQTRIIHDGQVVLISQGNGRGSIGRWNPVRLIFNRFM